MIEKLISRRGFLLPILTFVFAPFLPRKKVKAPDIVKMPKIIIGERWFKVTKKQNGKDKLTMCVSIDYDKWDLIEENNDSLIWRRITPSYTGIRLKQE